MARDGHDRSRKPAGTRKAAFGGDPLDYPGPPPETDIILDGEAVRPLRPAPGLDLGYWTLDGDPVPLTADLLLKERGAAPVEERTPLLAIGGNRNPRQLARRLAAAAAAQPNLGIIPVTRVFVRYLASGHSAHVAAGGYIPLTPVMAEGWHEHWVLWTCPAQLAALSEYEQEYELTTAPRFAQAKLMQSMSLPPVTGWRRERGPQGKPVVTAAGWSMFRSLHWALKMPGTAEPALAGDQRNLYAVLLRMAWFQALLPAGSENPEGAVTALAADAGRRDAVREGLREHGLVVSDKLS